MSSTYTNAWYMTADYKRQTHTIHIQKKSHKNLRKLIGMTFSIDAEEFEIKIYDMKTNEYVNIEKYELNKIRQASLIHIVNAEKPKKKCLNKNKNNEWRLDSKVQFYSGKWLNGKIINVLDGTEWVVVKSTKIRAKEMKRNKIKIIKCKETKVTKNVKKRSKSGKKVRANTILSETIEHKSPEKRSINEFYISDVNDMKHEATHSDEKAQEIFTKSEADNINNQIDTRNQWKVNDKVEIYSETKSKWMKGQIIRSFADDEGEWLVVKYAGISIKEIQRNNKYIRPITLKNSGQKYAATVKKKKHFANFLSAEKMKQRTTILEEIKRKIMEVAENGSFRLLSKTKRISDVDLISESEINDVHFISELDFEYKEWNSNGAKYQRIFKEEICQVLPGVQSEMIKIKEVTCTARKRRFSFVDWVIVNYMKMKNNYKNKNKKAVAVNSPEKPLYKMAEQDQIEVWWKEKWYPATIIEIRGMSGVKGKYFKVRYNAKNGKNIFFINTEWFYSRGDKNRLRLPGDRYGDEEEWNPPGIAIDEQGIRAKDVYDLKVGHHVFVKYEDYWYRCEVTRRRERKHAEVIRLVDGESSKTWLNLWNQSHLGVIRLKDMRDANH